MLKVCLAEIRRSRPFLIALIGDRYGWVPPEGRMQAAVDEAGYATDPRGKSVTALEIEYGVLDSAEQTRRSRFYFRDPLPYDAMGPAAAEFSDLHSGEPGAVGAHARLEALKDRIRRELPDRCRNYTAQWDASAGRVTGLEAWGRQVLDDLWEDLDAATREYEHACPATWQEEERAVQDEFVATQCRDFIGRRAVVEALVEFAQAPTADEDAGWTMVVEGEPGSGKSSLYGELVKRLRGREDVLLLSHAAGVSPRAGSVDALLRRWSGELAAALREDDRAEAVSKREGLEELFRSLLWRASQTRRVVCLLDALNQFERTPSAMHLTWLPSAWPPDARLIATAIAGVETEALGARRGVRTLPLPMLDAREAEAIAESICGRYHRRLNPAVLGRLLAKRLPDARPAAGNPLWLELAIEELNLLDADDFARADRDFAAVGSADERLMAMLCAVAEEMPPDVAGLYGWLLDRTEGSYGAALARAFARLIALSRTGWREADLEALLPRLTGESWDPLRFAALRRGFRAHLVQRGGVRQWDFSHAQLRAAVAARRRRGDQPDAALHAAMAAHLGELPPDDPLRETERMFHLIGADDREGAAEVLGGSLSERELEGAANAIGDHLLTGAGTASTWMSSLTSPSARAIVPRMLGRLIFNVGDRIMLLGQVGFKTQYFRELRNRLQELVHAEPRNAIWLHYLQSAGDRLGQTVTESGDLDLAKRTFESNRATAKQLAELDPERVDWLRDVAIAQSRIGAVSEAAGDLQAALEAYQQDLSATEELVRREPTNREFVRDLSVSVNSVARVLVRQNNIDGALQRFRAGLALRERLTAEDPDDFVALRDVAMSRLWIGDALLKDGDPEEAGASFALAASIIERLVCRDPERREWRRDLALCHGRKGNALLAQGEARAALAEFEQALAVFRVLVQTDPANTEWQRDLSVGYKDVGDAEKVRGELEAAAAHYREAAEIRAQLVGQDQANAYWLDDAIRSWSDLGATLRQLGRHDDARRAFEAVVAFGEIRSDCSELNREHWETHARACQALTELPSGQYRPEEVVRSCEGLANAICHLMAIEPENDAWRRALANCYSRMGEFLMEAGDGETSLDAHTKALSVRLALAKKCPADLVGRHDLSVNHNRIGEIRQSLSDLAGALEAYSAALSLREELCRADSDDLRWPRALAVSHENVGDVLLALKHFEEATQSYRRALAIYRDLAGKTPEAMDLQRDLWMNHKNVGDLLRAQGDVSAALESYGEALALCEVQTRREPRDTEWQQMFAMSYEKIGEVLRDARDLSGALDSFKASLGLRDRIALDHPGDPVHLRVLWVSCWQVANVLDRLERNVEATPYWHRAYRTLAGMHAAGARLSPQDERSLVQLTQKVRSLEEP